MNVSGSNEEDNVTDRMFADCCYGTEQQHTPRQLCPQDVEIVARACYEQQFPGSEWPHTADRADSWREMARAAIAALAKDRLSALPGSEK
jgi:hypothetical protein